MFERVALGVPVPQRSIREHPDSQDIIAGREFLSLFLEAARQPRRQRIPSSSTTLRVPTTTTISTTPQQVDLIVEESEHHASVVRDSRSSLYSYKVNFSDRTPINPPSDYYPTENVPTTNINDIQTSNEQHNDEAINSKNNDLDAKVISIRVSASVGASQINKQVIDLDESSTLNQNRPFDNFAADIDTTTVEITTIDRNILQEQTVEFNAASSKSELTVDEQEPMTFNTSIRELEKSLKEATLNEQNPIPSTKMYGANQDYLEQQRIREAQLKREDSIHPYQHSVIYHGHGKEGARGRSVSYSTVIQNVQPEGNWEQAETIERPSYYGKNPATSNDKDNQSQDIKPNYRLRETYDQTPFDQTFSSKSQIPENLEYSNPAQRLIQQDVSQNIPLVSPKETEWESRKLTVQTTTSQPTYLREHWKRPENSYIPLKPEIYSMETTSRPGNTWQQSESLYEKPGLKYSGTAKSFSTPAVYGMPEENYEVDEAVSVMSNGRTHGIQPTKLDDNHKVGYVVEGRNFRKYRVEERTSDGFIVGEYGVVSHDDGSLRGVRYTADGTINPRLIYDALMKFLSL